MTLPNSECEAQIVVPKRFLFPQQLLTKCVDSNGSKWMHREEWTAAEMGNWEVGQAKGWHLRFWSLITSNLYGGPQRVLPLFTR